MRLGAVGLFDLDEGLYTDAAREMWLSGDYVVPRVHGVPFFEKPPLIYWEAAASFTLLGRSELAARLPSACASALLVCILAWWTSKAFGRRRTAALGALFLALSPLVLAESRQLITDATLDLLIAVAVLCFFATQQRPAGPPRVGVRLAPLGFWAACGFGVLTKGLPGILVPVGVAIVYLVSVHGWHWRPVLRGIEAVRPGWGILVFSAIAAPWHLAALHRAGHEFVAEYVVKQHLGRFKGGDTVHREALWFYVPVFFLLCLPWSVYFPAALLGRRPAGIPPRDGLRTAPVPGEAARFPDGCLHDRARLLLKIWALVVFVLFTVMGTKLVSYILPMVPPAAILTADWCIREADSGRRRALVLGAAAALVLAAVPLAVLALRDPIAAAVAASTHRPVHLGTVPPDLWKAGSLAALAAMLGALAALVLAAAHRGHAALAATAAGMAAFAAVAVFGVLPAIHGAFIAPMDALAARAAAAAAPDGMLVVLAGLPRRPSVLFYLPDGIVAERPGAPSVIETHLAATARRLYDRHARCAVLAGPGHGAEARALPRARLLEERGGWQVFAKE